MARVVRKPGPGKEKLKILLDGLDTNKVGKVGWFPASKYPDGTPVAYIAAIQEFGYAEGGIRPRPFMRTTIAKRQKSWKNLADQGARAILAGNATIEMVLEGLGIQAAGDIADTISEIQTPQLKPATVKARMRRYKDKRTVGNLTKPLVDTAIMVNSVSSAVEEK